MKIIRRLVVLSDLHVGSAAALWPEIYTHEGTGLEVGAQPWQMKLLDYWEDFWRFAESRGEVDTVILAGEMCDGKNKFGWGKGLVTPDIDMQAQAAVQLLAPKVSDKLVHGVIGSLYHSSDDTETDHAVYRRLGELTDVRCHETLKHIRLESTEHILQLAHSASDALIYRAQAIDRDSLLQDAIEGPWDHCKQDFHVSLYIRGHWHWYLWMQTESRYLLCAPCWKFWSPIRRKLSKFYSRYQPSIGGVVLEIDETGYIHCLPKLYPLVKIYDKLTEG